MIRSLMPSAAMAACIAAPARADIPVLRKHGTATQLIVEDKPFLIIGGELSNSPTGEGAALAGIDIAHEGVFDATGQWKPGRLLNGDQTHQGRHIRLFPGKWQIQRVKFYGYR